MSIELLTGLHPTVAREIVDDTLFEELPALIERYHDGEAEPPAASAAAVQGAQLSTKCRWPPAPLRELSAMAAKCVRLQVTHRTTIADVLPDLERLA